MPIFNNGNQNMIKHAITTEFLHKRWIINTITLISFVNIEKNNYFIQQIALVMTKTILSGVERHLPSPGRISCILKWNNNVGKRLIKFIFQSGTQM